MWPGVRARVGPGGGRWAIKGRMRGPSSGELFSILAVGLDT